MLKLSLLMSSVILFAGCATNDYAMYAETQKNIAQAKAAAEVARYKALSEIAKSGDATASVAAVMAISMGQHNSSSTTQNVAAPKSPADTVLQWASILMPNITQLYGINRNAQVAIQQSNNAASVARSTNDSFVGIAGKIQAPQANVTTTNTTSTTDTSNNSTNSSTSTTSTVGGNNNTGANSGTSGTVVGGDQSSGTTTP